MPKIRESFKCKYAQFGCDYDSKNHSAGKIYKNPSGALFYHEKHCKFKHQATQSSVVINNITNTNCNNTTNNINITVNVGNEDITALTKRMEKADLLSVLNIPEYALSAYLPHLLWFNKDMPENNVFSMDATTEQPKLNGVNIDLDDKVIIDRLLQVMHKHATAICNMLGVANVSDVSAKMRLAWAEYGRIINGGIEDPVKVSDYWPGRAHLPLGEETISLMRMRHDMKSEIFMRFYEENEQGGKMGTGEIRRYNGL